MEPTKTDLVAILNEEQSLMGKERMEEHLHIDGVVGASDIGGCNLFGSYKAAHVPMPPKNGMKAESGAMDIGTVIHEWAQAKILHRNKMLDDFTQFGCEVMVKVQLTEKTAVESPIDIALATIADNTIEGDIFEHVYYKFRNESRYVLQINQKASWIQIWDIKSCSDFQYFKVWNNGQPKIPWKWQAQFHIYMKATGLKELTVLMIHKEKGWHREIVVKWDDAAWEKLLDIVQRKEEIVAELKKDVKNLPIGKDDLEYFNFDEDLEEGEKRPICWYSCNLSETYEEIDARGKPHLRLRKPCQAASYFLLREAKDKLQEGGKWAWGSSHITIDEINWTDEMVYCHNKKDEMAGKNRTKSCSIYVAVDSFEPIKPKEGK